MTPTSGAEATVPDLELEDLGPCFEGAVPGVLCTADAEGLPNVCYVSRAHRVDRERVAISNQFLSKTSRNIAVNPRASLLLIDPLTYDEFRLQLVWERTERRGPTFERLRADIDALAAIVGMQGTFRLRAADVFRVVELERVPPNPSGTVPPPASPPPPADAQLAALAELTCRMARCGTLDDLLDATLAGLDELLGHQHAYLLLADADGRSLSTFASRGFDGEAIGAEVEVGVGLVGTAAQRCVPLRVGNLRQALKYSSSIRRQYERSGADVAGAGMDLPSRADAESLLAVPVQALGQLVGVIVVESPQPIAYGATDEQLLVTVGAVLAQAVDHLRALDRLEDEQARVPRGPDAEAAPAVAAGDPVAVRFYEGDGSTFVDGEYLIRGVAGRILWALLGHHEREGRVDFTNKELRLDPSLDLPGFKDNLESRLLLLKRRLDERGAPVRLVKTGRGCFRMDVAAPLRLEVGPTSTEP